MTSLLNSTFKDFKGISQAKGHLKYVKNEIIEMVNGSDQDVVFEQPESSDDYFLSAAKCSKHSTVPIIEDELNEYTTTPTNKPMLQFWRPKEFKFPYLPKIAKSFHVIPATNPRPERYFSI